jgi:uncharacterized membrane protein
MKRVTTFSHQRETLGDIRQAVQDRQNSQDDHNHVMDRVISKLGRVFGIGIIMAVIVLAFFAIINSIG